MRTFAEAKEFFQLCRNPDVGRPLQGRNGSTRLVKCGKGYGVQLHNTIVVRYDPNGSIVLNDGGWRTVTTKDRINGYGPGYISQEKGIWYYSLDGNKYLWKSPLTVTAKGNVEHNGKAIPLWSEDAETQAKKFRKQVKSYATKFIEKLYAGELSQPGAGDCMECTGMLPGDGSEHIRSHIQEKYYVPSLLRKALDWQSSQSMQWTVAALWAGNEAAKAAQEMDWEGKRLVKMLFRYCLKEMGLPH